MYILTALNIAKGTLKLYKGIVYTHIYIYMYYNADMLLYIIYTLYIYVYVEYMYSTHIYILCIILQLLERFCRQGAPDRVEPVGRRAKAWESASISCIMTRRVPFKGRF
jgi:hypothetical protein